MKRIGLLSLCLLLGLAAPASALTSRDEDQRGEALLQAGRFEEAEAAFASALALEPANGRALLLRAQAQRGAAGAPSGQRTLVDLTGVPLELQDLSGLALSGLEIVEAHAPRSLWTGARLDSVAFARAQLNGADLRGAEVRRSLLNGAILDGAQAAGASFDGSSFIRARAPLLSARGASFVRARAVAADFSGADFTDADFAFADMRAVRFGAARMDRARFLNADLRGADLSRVVARGVQLAGARVDCATRFPQGFDPDAHLLAPLDLCGGRFALDYRGKDLADVSFSELDVRGALFANALLAGADFTKAILDGADFDGASGFDAQFAPASAKEASFEGASGALTALEGADLRNARLTGADAGALELAVSRSGPRLEGASLKTLRLTLSHRGAGEAGDASAPGLHSLLQAQIAGASISCGPPPARARRDAAAAAEWGDFADMLDVARRIAAPGAGNALAETCRRGIELYLSEGCQRGYRAAGLRYACPAGRR
ncbi:MAG: putative low-complexity protein [Hyphomicrobiales bacterium]|nr:putative low-complexity protein [Hyphomicrobiales bacterium]